MEGAGRDPIHAEAAAPAGRCAGRGLRETAVELYGREAAEAEWRADGRMRAQLRLLLSRAGAPPGAGLRHPGRWGGARASDRAEEHDPPAAVRRRFRR